MNQLSESHYTLVQITTVYVCQKENLICLQKLQIHGSDFHEMMPSSIDEATI